jgi:hypothetical protein
LPSILGLAATERVVRNVDGLILAGAERRVCAGFIDSEVGLYIPRSLLRGGRYPSKIALEQAADDRVARNPVELAPGIKLSNQVEWQ